MKDKTKKIMLHSLQDSVRWYMIEISLAMILQIQSDIFCR